MAEAGPEASPPDPQSRATLKPEGSRLLLLISSMSGSLEVKSRQSRIRGILDGLLLSKDEVEILDGSDPAVKPRRLELFIISGKRAQYPQLFLVKPGAEKETTEYVGNAEDVFYLHDTDTLGDAIGLCVLDTPPPSPPAETTTKAENEEEGPVMDKSLTTAWVRTKSTRNISLEKEPEDKLESGGGLEVKANEKEADGKVETKKDDTSKEGEVKPEVEQKTEGKNETNTDSGNIQAEEKKDDAPQQEEKPEAKEDPKRETVDNQVEEKKVNTPQTQEKVGPVKEVKEDTPNEKKDGKPEVERDMKVESDHTVGDKEQKGNYKNEHERAAAKIQVAIRVFLLPLVRLKKKLKEIKKDTKKQVERTYKDTGKKIAKIQKQYEKDCKKVDKLAKDIRRQQRKERHLKKDIKTEQKLRDKLRKKNRKEKEKAKKCNRYLKNIDKERKHLATWDKDIAAIQAENERLLALITKISEEISMRGVNWLEMQKEMERDDNETSEAKTPSSAMEYEKITAKKEEPQVSPPAPAATSNKVPKKAVPAPARVPQRRRLQSILQRQDAQKNMLSMVRQESTRLSLIRQESKRLNSGSRKAANNIDIEVAPVYFARLNSRARLLG